jgi:hypothetical protein
MGPQPTDPAARHAPEILGVARRPLSNGWVSGDQQVTGQGRPWPAPGPDARWWHGEAPARHRERPALPAAPQAPTAVLAPPIWEPEDDAMRPGRPPRVAIAARPRRVRPPRATRRPLPGLTAAVVLGLLAAFFGWFAAEPLWLSLGHSSTGTATARACPVARTCADFTADGNAFVATGVTLLGTGAVRPGTTVPARMVSPTGSAAYVGGAAPRWVPSLLAVLLCGFGIAWLTGGYRLPGRRRKLFVVGLSLAGPLLIVAGMLAVTW